MQGLSLSILSLLFPWLVAAWALAPAERALAKEDSLTIQHGVLDLRGFQEDLDDLKIYELTGEWAYYPGRFLLQKPEDSLEFKDPSSFWQNAKESPFAKVHRASFFFTLKKRPDQKQQALLFKELPQYRVYVDGQLALQQGNLDLETTDLGSQRGNRRLTLPDKESIDIILHVSTGGIRWQPWSLGLRLGSIEGVQSWIVSHTITLSLLLGGIFVTGVYHFILFSLSRRRKAPLILGFFCLCHVARNLLGSEVDTVFHLWPHFNYELSYKIGYICFFLAQPLFLHFLFLSFPQTLSIVVLFIFWALSSGFILLTLFTPVSFYGHWAFLYQFVLVIGLLPCLVSLVRALRLQQRGSYTLLTGSLIIFFAVINDMLHFYDLIQTGELIPLALFVFILLQSTILSSQVASTVRELRHTYKELTKIAHLHMVQRIASGFRIEQTMPIGFSQGTVICFDIVGSSRISNAGFHEALERLMGRCYEEMNLHYDPRSLEGRAYRIKEMGDGLLCSVGFPFHLNQSRSQASEAYHLALDFSRIFREEMNKLEDTQVFYCAIGIVSGSIEGFFPRFGIKQYDLRGPSIILATRYESMRNQVYRVHGFQGSVIFIHDSVYQKLEAEEQARFQMWDCTQEQQRIRDDPFAERAWFCFVEPAFGRSLEDPGSFDELTKVEEVG